MTKSFVISKCEYKVISNYMLADLKKNGTVFLYEEIPFLKIKRNKKRLLNRIVNEQAEEKVVFILNESLLGLNVEDLIYLKGHGTRLILLLIDPIDAPYDSAKIAKDMIKSFKFDEILTFDSNDAEKYGFKYTNCLYSKIENTRFCNKQCYDLFYTGNIKNRQNFIEIIERLASENNTKLKLMVLGYNMRHYLPYAVMLRLLNKTNCILDITQDNQSGITLRYYEAVVYNKKLLTNNNHIKKLSFYDERFMHIYNDVNDIDWEWVKKVETIDYKYNNEFSPLKLTY